jgi:glyceraldehyde 3-phosphate dehydrogenase
LATAVKPIVDSLGWVKGFMTTVHSYTNDQNILDAPHKDLRRARNAATNIIPTSTGAAKALYLVIPEIKGTFDGFALRVPTPDGLDGLPGRRRSSARRRRTRSTRSCARPRTGDSNATCSTTTRNLVSSDFKRSPYSSIFDSSLTGANGDLIQIAAWYDNEWGYSCRLADLTDVVLEKLPSEVA